MASRRSDVPAVVSHPPARPLAEADLGRVHTVFTDVDGTLTTQGRLTSAVLEALETLETMNVGVVLVSGRPASWAETWLRQLPVRGAIAENGGVGFARRGAHLFKWYAEKPRERLANRKKLQKIVGQALKAVRGSRLSMDSIATEVDLAIDYAEDARLGPKGADAIETFLRARGVTAVRSSVHVNCWLGKFDKQVAVETYLAQELETRVRPNERRFVYVGDSFNDAPMFAAIPLSVGVANVLDVWSALSHPPAFITRAREGHGFVEVAKAIARARR